MHCIAVSRRWQRQQWIRSYFVEEKENRRRLIVYIWKIKRKKTIKYPKTMQTKKMRTKSGISERLEYFVMGNIDLPIVIRLMEAEYEHIFCLCISSHLCASIPCRSQYEWQWMKMSSWFYCALFSSRRILNRSVGWTVRHSFNFS